MTTTAQNGSAKIYQFPARGRFAARQDSETVRTVEQAERVVVGSAWYHDEAIEADRVRKSS